MKVRATAKGFDGWALREPGTVFEIKDSQFTSVWMEKVSDDTVETGIKSPLIGEVEVVENPVEKPVEVKEKLPPPMFKSKMQKAARK